MRTEKEVREKIKDTEEGYEHVLKGDFATLEENAPRALMQLSAKTSLECLYWTLGEKCPKYEYEAKRKPS